MAEKEYLFRNQYGEEVWIPERLAVKYKNVPGFEYIKDSKGERSPIPPEQEYEKRFIIDQAGNSIPKSKMREFLRRNKQT